MFFIYFFTANLLFYTPVQTMAVLHLLSGLPRRGQRKQREGGGGVERREDGEMEEEGGLRKVVKTQ